MWEKKNVRDGCNTEGYLDKLESIQEQLELCKKSLADFLDGRRRQFPRYYFVSEADLLDILSNGSDPYKILVHTPKVGGPRVNRIGIHYTNYQLVIMCMTTFYLSALYFAGLSLLQNVDPGR